MSAFNEDQLPHQARRRISEERLKRDAETAATEGKTFDDVANETEAIRTSAEGSSWPVVVPGETADAHPPRGALAEWPELSGADQELVETIANLERDVRNLFVIFGDVLDAGSFDAEYMQKLGLDICLRPDLLILLKDRAKSRLDEAKVRLDAIVDEADQLEIEMALLEKSNEAYKKLVELGVEDDEVLELLNHSPERLRSYARLLDAPLLGAFIKGVKEHVAQGSTFSLENLIGEALTIVMASNTIYAEMEKGNPEAGKILLEELKRPENSTALVEAAELSTVQRGEPGIPKGVPRLDEGFDDIPRTE